MAETIELPKDAEGREIPLDTRTLYDKDGKAVHVLRWVFLPFADEGLRWRAESKEFPHGEMPENFHLTTPDSWESLEADIESMSHTYSPCSYFNHNAYIPCSACPAGFRGNCNMKVVRDIFRRSKALAERDANGCNEERGRM